MSDISIEAQLMTHGARFDGAGIGLDAARSRGYLTRLIAANFSVFEVMRDALISIRPNDRLPSMTSGLLAACLEDGLVVEVAPGKFRPTSPDAQRYLRGGWLEEYAGLASEAAGADEVRIGQAIKWMMGGFSGVNEIDVLARFGTRTVFISAKAFRSDLGSSAGHRVKLMDALHEADNILDHFGDHANSQVFLFVTTDMYDEKQRRPRYEQFYGKATALNVELVTLDNMNWESLVARLAKCKA